MWLENLGSIDGTENAIGLIPRTRTFISTPYLEGPKAKELEQKDHNKEIKIEL